MRSRALAPIAAVMIAVCAAGVSCKRAKPATNPQPGSPATAAAAEIRIVSLSPAVSRTLVDFGLADQIIGRSPHCFSLDQKIPVAGDLLNVNYEQLIRLNPTHVLVQPPASGMDPALTKLAEERGWTIGSWRLDGIDDIKKMVAEMPSVLADAGSAARATLETRSGELRQAIDASVRQGANPTWAGRTMIVYQVNPVMAFGKGTYLDDVLAAVGGVNAIEAQGWVQLSLEDVVRLDPQAIIILNPGASDASDAPQAAGPLWDLDITAMRERRLAMMIHPDALLPSSAVGGARGVAQELRSILNSFDRGSPDDGSSGGAGS